jgi:hypothetical protein
MGGGIVVHGINDKLIKFKNIRLRPHRRLILHIWHEIKDRKSRVFLEDQEACKLRVIVSDVDKKIHQLEHIKSIVETLLLHSGNKNET